MLKQDILKELEENRDMPISGQYLAEKYNVSRNAVWKAVNNLKKEGHRILSATNKGYVLDKDNDVLSVEGIQTFLPDEKDLKIIVFDSIDSTNNEAKRMLASGFAGEALIVANEQTAGRGRRGNSFYSPKQTGLYFSMILNPIPFKGEIPLFTVAAAIATVRGIRNITGIETKVKWVNDLFLGPQKICGILSEAMTDLESGMLNDIVVGIGINLSTEEFPDSIKQPVGSLGLSSVNRNQLAAEIVKEWKTLDLKDPSSFIGEYRSYSNVIGRKLIYDNRNALALDITEDAGLLIRFEDGTEDIIRGGEIRFA